MNQGKLVFAQVTEHLPLTTFRRCASRYHGEFKVRSFSCLDQFLCMAFAQLTFRESLREIEACLRAHTVKLYHMGIRCKKVSRSTLADANEARDWRIYADFAQSLIGMARRLYAQEPFGVDLSETVYALDATTIDLCLSLFRFHQAGSFFVTRAKANSQTKRRYSHQVDRSTGLICDHTVIFTGAYAQHDFPVPLRRIRFKDPDTRNTLVFLTNNFTLPALTITQLYRCRW